MEIRYGRAEDLAAIAALEACSYPAAEGASRESIRARLAAFPRHFWLLTGEDGALLAFVNGAVTAAADLTDEMYDHPALHREDGPWQMIYSVVTSPEHRGRGYAGMLLRRVIADARAQGRRGVVLTCKECLLGFYGQFGFLNEGISASVHGQAVWYQMRLTF